MLERAFEDAQENQRPPDADHRRQPHRLGRPDTEQDTHNAHGEPLGDKEIEGAKKFYGFPTKRNSMFPTGYTSL